jgi:uncharacterized protein
MPHQCTQCQTIYPDASEELLKGCSCGSTFFYYIREEKAEQLQSTIDKLNKMDTTQIEQDIRKMSGLADKPEELVILDLEAIKVITPGKFEIDVSNLFSRERPLIYKLEEGKYFIDIGSSIRGQPGPEELESDDEDTSE